MKSPALLLAVPLAAVAFAIAADNKPAAAPEPAPATDRVGFPKNYRENFTVLRRENRAKKQQVVTSYGNAAAAGVTRQEQLPYPYGSVFVLETAEAAKDAAGQPLLDDKGFYQRGPVTGLHVMRREKGFGAAYAANRTGEWEYVEYKPDGSYATTPQNSAACAACHVKAGAERDWVHRGRFPAKETMK